MPRFGMLENCGFLLGSHWDIIMFIIQLLSYRISHHINQLMHDFVYQPIKPSWDIGVLVLKRWTSRHPNDIQDQAEKKPNQIPRWVDFQHKNSDMFCQSFTKHPQSHVECQTHTHTLCTYPFSTLFLVFLTLIILFFCVSTTGLRGARSSWVIPKLRYKPYAKDTNWYGSTSR